MDEANIYGSTSDGGRYMFNEPTKEMDEPMEENDDDDARQARRMDRRRRRAERRSKCRCGSRSRRRRRRRIMSQNPYIIFFLEMYYKDPGKRVTEVARAAGKEWSAMSDEDKQKYIRLAEKERNRRCMMMRRRERDAS